jgi:hypothetical protein
MVERRDLVAQHRSPVLPVIVVEGGQAQKIS